MNTQEIEQIVLAISQTMLILNQLFMTKKMNEGMGKLAKDKNQLNKISKNLSDIADLLTALEDRINDLVSHLNTVEENIIDSFDTK